MRALLLVACLIASAAPAAAEEPAPAEGTEAGSTHELALLNSSASHARIWFAWIDPAEEPKGVAIVLGREHLAPGEAARLEGLPVDRIYVRVQLEDGKRWRSPVAGRKGRSFPHVASEGVELRIDLATGRLLTPRPKGERRPKAHFTRIALDASRRTRIQITGDDLAVQAQSAPPLPGAELAEASAARATPALAEPVPTRTTPSRHRFEGLRADQMQPLFERYLAQGWRPSRVKARNGARAATFDMTFLRQPGPLLVLQHSIAARDWDARKKAWDAKGFTLVRMERYRVGSVVQFLGLWEDPTTHRRRSGATK